MGARGEGQQPLEGEPDQGWAAMVRREPGRYWAVVGLLVRVTLSPTERSRTWATREREPSIDSPSTSVTESPTRSPAVSPGLPATTLVSTAAARLADPSA